MTPEAPLLAIALPIVDTWAQVLILALSLAALALAVALHVGSRRRCRLAEARATHATARARRATLALRSALADDRLAILAWDARGRFAIAEGGLYRSGDIPRPEIGADARAVFHAWGPAPGAAFDAVSAGEWPDPYEIRTPEALVTPGEPARVYSVRLRPNEAAGAGYATVHDVTAEAEAARAARIQAERKARDAERRADEQQRRADRLARIIGREFDALDPSSLAT